MWILWVPVTETKEEIGYADQQSSLMAQIEQKVPTEKQMQQLKEKMGTWGEDDDNLFTRPSPSDPILGFSRSCSRSSLLLASATERAGDHLPLPPPKDLFLKQCQLQAWLSKRRSSKRTRSRTGPLWICWGGGGHELQGGVSLRLRCCKPSLTAKKLRLQHFKGTKTMQV